MPRDGRFMTLAELIPSLRAARHPHLDAGVWPATARWGDHGDLLIGGVRTSTIAAACGTAVQLMDEADVRARCAAYIDGFGAGNVFYSARAGLTEGTGRWIAGAGLGCYTGSAAELRTALLAGFPAARTVLYGSAKSVADREAAYACGAALVLGTLAEVRTVAATAPAGQRVLLRVVPSTAGRRHVRYGFRLGSSTALAAITLILAHPNLELTGLDCSIGHQLSRFGTFESCLREAMAFRAVVHARSRIALGTLNLGGGHAVAYTSADDGFALAAFASRARAMMSLAADRHGIPQPRLTVSPGRALTARAGVTLHRVTAVETAGDTPTVFVDGAVGCGTAEDCAGRHTVALAGRVSVAGPRTVTLTEEPYGIGGRPVVTVQLPADVAPGDLVVVAGTGAYHDRGHGSGRPPVAGVADGTIRTFVRRSPALFPAAVNNV